MICHQAGSAPADHEAAGGEEDEHWDRKFGSGPAGTSAGAAGPHSSGGRQRLEEQRTIFTNAVKRKAQVGQPPPQVMAAIVGQGCCLSNENKS